MARSPTSRALMASLMGIVVVLIACGASARVGDTPTLRREIAQALTRFVYAAIEEDATALGRLWARECADNDPGRDLTVTLLGVVVRQDVEAFGGEYKLSVDAERLRLEIDGERVTVPLDEKQQREAVHSTMDGVPMEGEPLPAPDKLSFVREDGAWRVATCEIPEG